MNAAAPTNKTALKIASAVCGYCAFINLYSTQSLLPYLQKEFNASAASVSWLVTVSVFAVALSAPFAGTVADVLGRKRVIVTAMAIVGFPTLFGAMTTSLPELMAWRFLQGLALPPIFAVTIAYIGEELPPREATAAIGLYTAGASLGGTSGRFFTGIITDLADWRTAFFCLAAISFMGATIAFFLLPRERHFVKSEGLRASTRQMLAHLRNPNLIATYAVGFCVLFNFINIFSFVNFHLAAPPYLMTPAMLGTIFLVYLLGSVTAPLVGRGIARFGRRNLMLETVLVWMIGVSLTLASPLWMVVLGLALCAACGLMAQAISTGYIATTTTTGRSSAIGLYATSFYVGGTFGGALGGIAWTIGHYAACVFLTLGVLAVIAAIVALFWQATPRPPGTAPMAQP